MDGLVIKPKWADLILSGRKTWEIRSRITYKRGTIAIVKSGSGLVYGTAQLVDCIKLSSEDFAKSRHKHCIPASESNLVKHYRELYAWVLEEIQVFPEPIKYNHPQGAVVWVRLPEELI